VKRRRGEKVKRRKVYIFFQKGVHLSSKTCTSFIQKIRTFLKKQRNVFKKAKERFKKAKERFKKAKERFKKVKDVLLKRYGRF